MKSQANAAVQLWTPGQPPHEPPQPSSPQVLSVQSGSPAPGSFGAQSAESGTPSPSVSRFTNHSPLVVHAPADSVIQPVVAPVGTITVTEVSDQLSTVPDTPPPKVTAPVTSPRPAPWMTIVSPATP